ncbi:transcription termination factor Rho [Candidatus Similichlamydia epinepheli]|uniref:transcription termination factor Rho n=1 Tax=Candidatus Similichlamydia epinepheli TaxID=1903953 RepID=UPI000D353F34
MYSGGVRDQQEDRCRLIRIVPEDNGGSSSADESISSSDRPTRITRIADLQRMNVEGLHAFAKQIGFRFTGSLTKSQMVFECVRVLCERPDEVLVCEGGLEILADGFGFLRSPNYNYLSSAEDIYVSPAQIRRFDLRKGDTVSGTVRPPKDKEKYFALHQIDKINGKGTAELRDRILFENLTPCYPSERLVMETTRDVFATRVIDLISPLGKGQRGIVLAPPRSGKTVMLQNIARAIATNHPEVTLLVLLIDERPEEVTDMLRTVKGEVVASTFDETPERHVQVAEMVIEKAKRLVEVGHDVVILLDSLTRLTRAYNTVQPHSGKILSGGIDANALHKPKRFFGAARNIEEGGSLTIFATLLVETSSRMDEVIAEEFKGTGTTELCLEKALSDRRIYPAIDIVRSGTRKEEMLYHPSELEKIYILRQATTELSVIDAMNLLLGRLRKTNSNVEFLLSLKD